MLHRPGEEQAVNGLPCRGFFQFAMNTPQISQTRPARRTSRKHDQATVNATVKALTSVTESVAVSRGRRKVELSVKFRLRQGQTHGEQFRQLQVRLTVNGVVTSDYASGIYVRPPQWSSREQKVKGRTPEANEVNEQLAGVLQHHRDILRDLKRRFAEGKGPRPNATLVKAEFQRPGITLPHLLTYFDVYLHHMDSMAGTEGYGEIRIGVSYKTRDHLRGFVEVAGNPLLVDLTTAWCKQFFAWLIRTPGSHEPRMKADTAKRYLYDLGHALNHAVEAGHINRNVLETFKPKGSPKKAVYFLEQSHLKHLLTLRYADRELDAVCWWAKLMSLTGLDYVDAIRYARNSCEYERDTSYGTKIIIDRTKPPHNTCEIPVLEGVRALFNRHPTGPHAPCLADLNRHLKMLEGVLGFTKRLSSKILRKTGGANFLWMGYRIAAVSKILGHSSISTTERHYVTITSSFIDNEMERVGKENGSTK